MPRRYRTSAELRAAREALESSMAGYRRPAAYGLGLAEAPQATRFPVRNVGDAHLLPAAVLASIVGYRNRSGTYPVTRAQFRAALAELAPAGHCPEYEHPNLWAWQQIQRDLDAGNLQADLELVAVFFVDLADPPGDTHQEAFMAPLAGRIRSEDDDRDDLRGGPIPPTASAAGGIG